MNTEQLTSRAKPPRVKEPQVTDPVVVGKIHIYVETAVPEKYRTVTERALLGQMSRANAVKAKCLQCSNYVLAEVRHCTVVTCPLHCVRPYQLDSEGEGEDETPADPDNSVE